MPVSCVFNSHFAVRAVGKSRQLAEICTLVLLARFVRCFVLFVCLFCFVCLLLFLFVFCLLLLSCFWCVDVVVVVFATESQSEKKKERK